MHTQIHNRPTIAIIDTQALIHNLNVIRQITGNADIMAVVKADAYGHGARVCAEKLQDAGVKWFAVATLGEALELREAGNTGRILVLGGCWPGEEKAFFEFGLTPAVFTLEQVRRIDAAAAANKLTATVHLKFDTGMGRVGFRYNLADSVANEIRKLENIDVEAIFSHFSAADNPAESDFTRLQNDRLDKIIDAFLQVGIKPRLTDIANSPGAILFPESRRNLVRIGGLLYGFKGDILPQETEKPDVRPVMRLETEVAQVKTINPGDSVGYGRTFVAGEKRVIATIPIGYFDGLPRSLSNKGSVLVNGVLSPIVGRISMDWTTIDVTEAGEVKEGTKVTIIGRDGELELRAEDIAGSIDTISYEITCGISRRVPRIYI